MSKSIVAQEAETRNGFFPRAKQVTGLGVLVDLNARGRDRKWGQRKQGNVKMSELVKMANAAYIADGKGVLFTDNVIERFDDCGSLLEFTHYEDGTKKLTGANFCKHRICPLCCWRKSLKMFAQVERIVSAITAKEKVRFIFLTFTQKNVTGEELPAMFDRMNEAFKWIFQRSKNYARAKRFKSKLLGYLKAVEITYNAREDTYHPHIHVIAIVKPSYFKDGYGSQQSFQAMWREAMHLDYDPFVNVKAIKTDEDEKPTPKAVAEVAKYPVKIDNLLNIADTDKPAAVRAITTLAKTCHNRRFVTFGGMFHEYKKQLGLDDLESGDLVHVETERDEKASNIVKTLWRYNAKLGVYIN